VNLIYVGVGKLRSRILIFSCT